MADEEKKAAPEQDPIMKKLKDEIRGAKKIRAEILAVEPKNRDQAKLTKARDEINQLKRQMRKQIKIIKPKQSNRGKKD